MKIENRKSAFDELHKYDYMSNRKDNDFIEVTEWTNGEGWDINIGHKNRDQIIQLTRGELDAINYLTKALKVEE